jgi:hypothetical protein
VLIAQCEVANELDALDLGEFAERALYDFFVISPKARTAVALLVEKDRV